MKRFFSILAAACALSSCASDPEPKTPTGSSQLTMPSGSTVGVSENNAAKVRSLGDDARSIRESAAEAIEGKDKDDARASVEAALDKHVPAGSAGGSDKRTEMLDKATDAARDKAKELGKEDDLDKVRSALDDFLKKKD